MGAAPGWKGGLKAILLDSIKYLRAAIVRERWPSSPFPRIEGTDLALDWISACNICRERKVGRESVRTVSLGCGNVVDTLSIMIGTIR